MNSEPLPKWEANEIRHLRSRLGWSQAEFARQMKCDLATISAWELGMATPPNTQHGQLVRILQQAEANCERVQRRPIAEIIMKDRNLSQIHDLEVIESAVTIEFTRGN